MKHGFPHVSPPFRRREERGVALIIVLGFLGLMVMMAVAFMVQARVERMVADTTLEGMRARQIVQSGLASALQDYVNASIEALQGKEQPPAMFLSGDTFVSRLYNSGLSFGSTNLWIGEAVDWLPETLNPDIDLDEIEDNMEWLWVREEPGKQSRILGRYAYVCLNLSGGVDANLLGRDYGEDLPANGYGATTNRNNVRKMFFNAISTSPNDTVDRQLKLAKYQRMWQGFDTPAALNKLTDGIFHDGKEKGGAASQKPNRWAKLSMDERKVGGINTAGLSCYSYAVTWPEKKECTPENIDGDALDKLVGEMGGDRVQVRKAIEDYFDPSPVPQGTDYPSVKAVPMFNEIEAELKLEENGDAPGGVQLVVTIKPEFWCPFPSKDTPDANYTLEAPEMGGGSKLSDSTPIWIYAQVVLPGKVDASQVTFEQAPGKKPEPITVKPNKDGAPKAADPFIYTLYFKNLPKNDDGSEITISKMQLRVRDIRFQKPWELKTNEGAVDSTPTDKPLVIAFSDIIYYGVAGKSSMSGFSEVDDPRLNHLAGSWLPSKDGGTMGMKNSCLGAARAKAKAKMGYEPGEYMYCRNGKMLSPAELGYIPVYDGNTPWMTLDIFSESGKALLNTLVCDRNVLDMLANHHVFYTNGTINPYTQDKAVLNGAFCGIDKREVLNPLDSYGNKFFTADDAKDISKELVKSETPDGQAFYKNGPAGWSRVLSYKGFDLNKNERVALAHHTWGLFNESDTTFLVFVVAQSITEAPEKVDHQGTWNEKEDMITGERWAVALCWMDTSMEGDSDDLTREMDIIMFKYLNE